MQRVTHATKSADLFGSGKDGYTDGVPNVTPPTILNSAAMNALQEEIARAIESFGGISLDPAQYDQLSKVLSYYRRAEELRRFRQLWLAIARASSPTGTDGSGATSFRGVACAGYLDYPDFDSYAYYMVGASAAIRVSKNGQAWSSGTAGSSYSGNFNGVIRVLGPTGLMLAYGASGEIQSCPVGQNTWTRRKNGGNAINAIATYGSLIIAGDSAGKIWTSSNGTSWTDRGVIDASGVSYVAVGPSSAVAFTGGGHLKVSTDNGVTWTNTTGPGVSTGYGNAVVWSASLGVFVYFYADGSNYEFWTSADGSNSSWTRMALGELQKFGTIMSIADVPGGVMALGNTGISGDQRTVWFDGVSTGYGAWKNTSPGSFSSIAYTYLSTRDEGILWGLGHDGSAGTYWNSAQVVFSP